MSYSFRPARREQIALLLGIAGGTGSGKTFSAMRLATGLAGGKRFAVLDTENGRAKHYADEFDFDVEDLREPFRPDRYADAILAAAAVGYGVIVVDSMSHEHAGDGGLLDWHEEELQRMAGDDYKRRETMNMAAWIKPKMAHKQMVSRLLQVNAHVILCFRAEEKIEIGRNAQGKTEVRPKQSLTGLDGWIPVSEKNLPYELTLSVLMTADAPGIPKPIKLQKQHRQLLPLDQQVGEDTGVALAAWAAGGEPKQERQAEPADDLGPLTAKLTRLLGELGIGDAAEMIAEKSGSQSGAEHAAWLRRQIGFAEQKLSESASGAEASQPAAQAEETRPESPPSAPEPASEPERPPSEDDEPPIDDLGEIAVPRGTRQGMTLRAIEMGAKPGDWAEWSLEREPGYWPEEFQAQVERWVETRFPSVWAKSRAKAAA